MKDAFGAGQLPCVIRCPDGEVEVTVTWHRAQATVGDLLTAIAEQLTGVAPPLPPLALSIGPERLDPHTSLARSGIRPGDVMTLQRAGAGPSMRRAPTDSGAVPARRPPRSAVAPPPAPVLLPDAPHPAGRAGAVSVAGITVPIVMAAVLVVVLHNLAWGLLSLLGPAVAVATGFEQHRRGTKRRRKDEQRFRDELMRLARDLHEAATAERARRRHESPAPGEVAGWPHAEAARMWERRPGDPDWLRVQVGTGDVAWQVPTTTSPATGPVRSPELAAMLDAASVLSDTPVTVDLSDRGVVGIAGPRAAALGLARSLVVQAAVLHGPSELAMAVASDGRAGADWRWARWLPHTVDADSGARRVVSGHAATDALRRACGEPPRQGAALLVVDDHHQAPLEQARARTFLRARAPGVGAIVLAESERDLPSCCSAVVQVGAGPTAEIRLPDAAPSQVRCTHLTAAAARSAARSLAKFDDPDAARADTRLPADLTFTQASGITRAGPDEILHRWNASTDLPPATVVGVSVDGPLVLDLAADGPHALLAGTTGAGKSELLRTLVLGLACSCPPEQLSFVLIDFKGGSAFDRCAGLPHIVGTITDLDGHLVRRALEGLEAELVRREELLRAAGADDLVQYRRCADRPALARLVVVIDEFATLAADHPGALEGLVGIAQRGRSMGVHLVLATQRPTGSVSAHIRANTNLRIALRVQDAADSTDVIGVPDAATLSRKRPGRALVRLGPGEVIAAQIARTTGTSPMARRPVELAPFGPRGDGHDARPLLSLALDRPPDASAPPSDRELDQLVEAIVSAHDRRGGARPHRPWPDPLPDVLTLDEVMAPAADHADAGIVFARADDPGAQRQVAIGWDPGRGNLLVAGAVASGTTTTLAAIALCAPVTLAGSPCHVHVVDFGTGDLRPLAQLPAVGNVIGAGELERQRRLVDHLTHELARRQAATGGGPSASDTRIVVLLDGAAAFAAAWSNPLEPVLEQLGRLLADGPGVGIHVAFTIAAVGGVPRTWIAGTRQRVVLPLADPTDAAQLGVRLPVAPATNPGRATWVDQRLVGQIAWPGPDLAAAVAARAATEVTPCPPPPAVGTLPSRVEASSLGAGIPSPGVRGTRGPWKLPIGVGDRELRPVALVLHPGEHALVAGPARSGRTTALATLAATARATSDSRLTIVALAHLRSPLRGVAAIDETLSLDRIASLPDLVRAAGRRAAVLVLADDVETVDDPDRHLAALLAGSSNDAPRVHVVGAGRAEALRGMYQHWSRGLRRAGVGVLLRPSLALDGDLLGVTLPRRPPAELGPGRGWVVDHGIAEFLQVAQSD